jgi:hypothetical protein
MELRGALHTACPRANLAVVPFGSKRHFHTLWTEAFASPAQMDGLSIDCANTNATLILTEPEIDPAADVRYASEFSAFRWAAAWRIKFPQSPLRVAVVGTPPTTTDRLLASLFSSQKPNGSSLIHGLYWNDGREGSQGSLAAWCDTNGPNPLQAHSEEIKLLCNTLWNNLTSEPGHQHSISNIIGSAILREHFGAAADPSVIEEESYLRGLLSACQKISDRQPAPRATAPWIESGKPAIEKFCIVDDMAKHWYPFLEKALGVPITDENWCAASDPVDVLPLVQNPETKAPWIRRKVSETGMDRTIVFLDLRFFPSGNIGAEFAFLHTLYDLACQIAKKNQATLPWPGFLSGELAKIKAALASHNRTSSGYYRALTLLPRLWAIADPTLPIVLFSSTRQRDISEALSLYGNIITDFQKPVITGTISLQDVIEQARNGLVKAMKAALKIAMARRLCAFTAESVLHPCVIPNKIEPPRSPVRKEQKPLIEVYVDESGLTTQENFSVACLVLVHNNSQDAERFHRDIHRTIIFGTTQYTGPGDRITVSKNPADSEKTRTLRTFLASVPGPAILGFAVGSPRATEAENQSLPALFNEANADNRFRALLERLLESVLFEHDYVSTLLKHGSLISIEVATRRSGTVEPAQIDGLKSQFGIVPQKDDTTGEIFYFSLQSDAVFPIVRAIIGRRGWPYSHSVLVSCRGVGLKYRMISPRTDAPPVAYSSAHFIADWVAKASRHIADGGQAPTCLAELFMPGFIQEKSLSSNKWNRASVYAGRGAYDLALLEIASEVRFHSQDNRTAIPSAVSWIHRRSGEWVSRLTPPQLLHLFERANITEPENV